MDNIRVLNGFYEVPFGRGKHKFAKEFSPFWFSDATTCFFDNLTHLCVLSRGLSADPNIKHAVALPVVPYPENHKSFGCSYMGILVGDNRFKTISKWSSFVYAHHNYSSDYYGGSEQPKLSNKYKRELQTLSNGPLEVFCYALEKVSEFPDFVVKEWAEQN